MFPSPHLNYYQPMTGQTTSQEHDQEEDSLSLCDLPIHNNPHSSSIDNYKTSNDESFEFFPLHCPSKETNHVIFCGKLIPARECPSHKKKKRTSLFFQRTKGSSTGKPAVDHGVFTRGGSGKRRSTFEWCSLVFGLQRFPVPKRMDMADMRDRLSRRRPMSLEEMFEKNTSYNADNSSRSNSKLDQGLSHLIRSLSCGTKGSISVLN